MYCTYDYFFRILCSLAKVDEAAQWEDVTDTVSVRSRTKGLQFETKVSAAFWLLVCRDAAAPAAVLRTAEIMYRHVARRHPYVARLSVFYRVVQLDLTPKIDSWPLYLVERFLRDAVYIILISGI